MIHEVIAHREIPTELTGDEPGLEIYVRTLAPAGLGIISGALIDVPASGWEYISWVGAVGASHEGALTPQAPPPENEVSGSGLIVP